MNKLLKIFDSRLAGIICFLFAIFNRIIFTSLYSLIGSDTKIQLTYAQNLLAGKGMGVTKYFTGELNIPIFDTHQWYPPGFSIAIIPFLKLSGGDEFNAVLAFDIITAILFIIAVRFLGKEAGLPASLNNIVTLIAGCSQYLFFMSWSSTDAISVCIILFALAATIDIIKKRKTLTFLGSIGYGILFCLPFFFRYMYLPIALLLPSLIALFGIVSKSKHLKAGGFKLLLSSVFLLALFFVFNLFTAGNVLHVHDVGRGFYFNQLARWYPFLPASFISLDFAAQLTEKFSGIEYSRMMDYFKFINGLLFVFFLIFLLRYIYSYKNKLQFSRHSIFIIIGSIISFAIIVLLAYLSLTYKELTWGLTKWTHVQHARYFSYLYIFVPLLFFVCLHNYPSFFKGSIVRILAFIALGCFVTEVLHGIYYNSKIIRSHQDLAIIRDADQGYRNFPAVIAAIKKRNPDGQVLVSSPDQYYLHAASQMGYKAIFDYENLWRTDLKVSSEAILLIPVHQQEAIIMKDYIDKKRPQLISTIAGTYFYIEVINPK
ncbi:MAG TPA: hypothetical protein VFH08_10970 [Chitinophagaceae bacterium]|nr:hypothetical protein [Chitinophagaceae bacterium]